MKRWNFAKKNDQELNLVDPISDSKFGVDKYASFTREIIQNSLDALNTDKYTFVKIKFEFKKLKLSQVPGGEYLLSVLKKCVQSSSHKDTIIKFNSAIDMMENDNILCLKVSDYNTKGMYENNWSALLDVIGSSCKSSTVSAGRHGVGKKASFVLSNCNTVFYSSKNISDETRFGGKSLLIDFKDDDGSINSSKGWYGIVEKQANYDRVLPVRSGYEDIDDFFIRDKEYGSDVIAICVYDKPEMRNVIVNTVIDNFYVGLAEHKIEVDIDGVLINKNTLNQTLEKYYDTKFKLKGLGSDNIVVGLAKRYAIAYQAGIKDSKHYKKISLKNIDGYLDLYYDISNENEKKYYAFYRDHGMKIRDYKLTTDKPFSAVVVARGQQLNEFLLSIENQAHDDFTIDDSDPEIDRKKSILFEINKAVEDYIKSFSKVEVQDKTILDINDMVTFFGDVSTRKGSSNKPKQKDIHPQIQSKQKKKTKTEWIEPGPFDVEHTDHEIHNHNRKRPRKIKVVTDEENSELETSTYYLEYSNYFVVLQNKYSLILEIAVPIKKASIFIEAQNVDGTFNNIFNQVESLVSNDLNLVKADDCYYCKKLQANKTLKFDLKLKNNSRYKIYLRIMGLEDTINE